MEASYLLDGAAKAVLMFMVALSNAKPRLGAPCTLLGSAR